MTSAPKENLIIRRIKNIGHLFMAAFWAWRCGFPGNKLSVVGVTGTDGKTTTTYMIYHLLKSNGRKVALINTVEAIVGEVRVETGAHVTTQNPHELQMLLKRIVKQGYDTVVLEVTSHALDQHRVWGIGFDIAVVTNIKDDHLDYHQSHQNYLEAKARLFDKLGTGQGRGAKKTAVLNAADASFGLLSRKPCTSQIVYNSAQNDSAGGKLWLSASLQGQSMAAIRFDLHIDQNVVNCEIPLLGTYNLDNAQAAAGVALAYGISAPQIAKSLSSMPQIPGRMQKIDEGQKFTAIVDFAHTPAALEHALSSLRQIKQNRLLCVFGCAGSRDIGRRRMGEVSARLADVTILTNEDNRGERVEEILGQIATFAKNAGAKELTVEELTNGIKLDYPVFCVVPERREAIRLALSVAQDGDIVDFSGKGHEPTLNVDGVETPWGEARIVEELRKMKVFDK